MTAPLLEVRNLEVRYGDLIGIADVSLKVAEGSIVALLGSNGAGKTTTLNAIAGVVPASAGQIEFQGRGIAGEPAYRRASPCCWPSNRSILRWRWKLGLRAAGGPQRAFRRRARVVEEPRRAAHLPGRGLSHHACHRLAPFASCQRLRGSGMGKRPTVAMPRTSIFPATLRASALTCRSCHRRRRQRVLDFAAAGPSHGRQ